MLGAINILLLRSKDLDAEKMTFRAKPLVAHTDAYVGLRGGCVSNGTPQVHFLQRVQTLCFIGQLISQPSPVPRLPKILLFLAMELNSHDALLRRRDAA